MSRLDVPVPYPGKRAYAPAAVGYGPCCERLTCVVRECWPYPGETHEQMVARLKAKYNPPAMAQEAAG